MSSHYSCAIIGSGAWGSAISLLLSSNGNFVKIFPKFKNELNAIKKNETPLEGIKFPKNIFCEKSIDCGLSKSDFESINAVFWCIPTKFSVDESKKIFEYIPKNIPIIICSKGIIFEKETSKIFFLHDYFLKKFPENQICILSGPNFANEVANGVPSAAIIASKKIKEIEFIKEIFPQKIFKIFFSDDVISTQIAGAFKNVLAIACGILMGINFGKNSISALITYGILEIREIIKISGGNEFELFGLAGIGDITLTCLNMNSRNTKFGFLIGSGEKINDILEKNEGIKEGYDTAMVGYEFTKRLGVNTKIITGVYNILFKNHDPAEEIKRMME